MMNLVEEAIVYATIMHQGKVRKLKNSPYILHPMEVAQILAAMTNDQEIIVAGILHDIVEDTDGTLEEIRKRFGERVAALVDSETENAFLGESRENSWQKRKETSLQKLKDSRDIGVKMLWLADKLANIRSLAQDYSESGEKIWTRFHQKDPAMQRWYFRTVAEYVELDLNKTGAYKEFIKHINSVWPGTFNSEKAKYRKYREVSVSGCKLLGSGHKGDVYRYDNELILKVYNHKNTYADVEREIMLSRKAFVLGVPTAISFGIVSVGDCYGAMYELVDSDNLTACIARNPSGVMFYADVMAQLAIIIHGIEADQDDTFPDVKDRYRRYIDRGLEPVDKKTAERCQQLLNAIPRTRHLIHGDFHTSNAFIQGADALIIDMDRMSVGDPIFELGDVYLYYYLPGKRDPEGLDPYLGTPGRVNCRFFEYFLKYYLQTEDEERLRRVTERAALLADLRLIQRYEEQETISPETQKELDALFAETAELSQRIEELSIT